MVNKVTTSKDKMSELDKIAKDVKIDLKGFDNFNYLTVKGERKEAWLHKEQATTSKGVIRGGTFGEEIYLIKKIGEFNGLELVLPDFRAIMEAFRYKGIYDWIRSNLIIQKTSDGIDIRRVLDVEFVDKDAKLPPSQVLVDNETKEILEAQTIESILQTRYFVGPTLQTEISMKTEYFEGIKGFLPVDAELRGGRNYWRGGSFDKYGRAAVLCTGRPEGVSAYFSPPSHDISLIPIYTERDPKR